MAAVTLNEQQLNKSLNSKKRNKKPAAKAVLCYPYVAKWPPVDKDTQHNIIKLIKQCFGEPLKEAEVAGRIDLKPFSKKLDKNDGALPEPQHKFRQLCVCGVNRVSRLLERDELQLVMVDRSSPWQLHQHLAQLSAVRQCKAVAIDNLSAVLGPLLSVTRLCAVGFKKELPVVAEEINNKLSAMVKEIILMCPCCELPWLQCDSYLQTLKAIKVEEMTQAAQVTSLLAEKRKTTADYSHLYVYKRDKPVTPASMANDFIMLPSSDDDDKYTDDDCEDDTNDNNNEIKILPTLNTAPKMKSEYVPANVGLQQANVAKKRKKQSAAKK